MSTRMQDRRPSLSSWGNGEKMSPHAHAGWRVHATGRTGWSGRLWGEHRQGRGRGLALLTCCPWRGCPLPTGVVQGQVPWMVRVHREGKRSRTGPCTGQGMRGGLAILDRQCPRGGNPETRKCAGKRQTAREGGSGCQTP